MTQRSLSCPACHSGIGAQRGAFSCRHCGERLRLRPPLAVFAFTLLTAAFVSFFLGLRGPFIIFVGLILFWPCLLVIAYLSARIGIPMVVVKQSGDAPLNFTDRRPPNG